MQYLNEAQRIQFPDPEGADRWGVVAIGGNLSPGVVLSAYEQGIFPWYDEPPILWHSPNPRFVLYLNNFRIPDRFRRSLKKKRYVITVDTAFPEVIHQCAAPRGSSPGTWITDEIVESYTQLHHRGYVHSIEVRRREDGTLAGGLYGIAVGGMFAGESMFSREQDSSKHALVALVGLLHSKNIPLLDCQSPTRYLSSFGAQRVPRRTFLAHVAELRQAGESLVGPWDIEDTDDLLDRGVELAAKNLQ